MKNELIVLAVLLSICGICSAEEPSSDAVAGTITVSDTDTYAQGSAAAISSGFGVAIATNNIAPSGSMEASASGAASGSAAGSIRGESRGRNSVFAAGWAGATTTIASASTEATANGLGTSVSTDINSDCSSRIRVW